MLLIKYGEDNVPAPSQAETFISGCLSTFIVPKMLTRATAEKMVSIKANKIDIIFFNFFILKILSTHCYYNK